MTVQQNDNNFSLLRLFLSLSVIGYHLHVLSQATELRILSKIFDADRAVQAFFVISGYLVMKSYKRSDSVKDYFRKRFLRIYPAYLLVIVLSVLMGVFVTTYPLPAYFASPELYQYFAANCCFLNFLQPSLPGVFESNYLAAVNGSLWTLKIEAGFYLVVPLIFLLRKKMNGHLLYALLFVASLAYYMLLLRAYTNTHSDIYLFLSRQLPGQLFYFIAGIWATELDNRRWFKPAITSLGVPSLIVLLLPVGVAASGIALAIVVFFVAKALPVIRYPFRREDISYGLYIYHFPVIQLLVYLGVFSGSVLMGVLLSLLLTIALAILSWVLVEKPFIAKRYSYSTKGLRGTAAA